MTDRLFFDSDCLSAFLWSGQESIVTKLYAGEIIIPQMVCDELVRVGNPLFKNRIKQLLASGQVEICDLEVGSEEFMLYCKMTMRPDPGFCIVGKGEAAALSCAYVTGGLIASSNFRDTACYICELKIRYVTTGDIMVEAYEGGLISETEGNAMWKEMLAQDCWIGAESFSEYLSKPYKPLSHY